MVYWLCFLYYLTDIFKTLVSDLTSGVHQREVFKPYQPTLPRHVSTKAKTKISTSPSKKDDNQNYMDLHEFLQQTEKNEDVSNSNSQSESDPDYPKPTVDLLASLLTLGKMIQNQKQLIHNQTKQITEPIPISIEPPSPIAEQPTTHDVDEQVDNLNIKHTENQTLVNRAYDIEPEQGFSYDESKTASSSPGNSFSRRQVVPEEIKDIDYYDRRKRNNLAAKKSREERRKKELEVVETTKDLEKENSQLTLILKRLTSRNEWLESRLQDIRRRRRTDASIESSTSLSSPDDS